MASPKDTVLSAQCTVYSGFSYSPKDTHCCVVLYPPYRGLHIEQAKIEETYKLPGQATPSKDEMAICLEQNTQKAGTLDTREHTSTSDTSYLGRLLSLNIGSLNT